MTPRHVAGLGQGWLLHAYLMSQGRRVDRCVPNRTRALSNHRLRLATNWEEIRESTNSS
jgi:hypothetical protein